MEHTRGGRAVGLTAAVGAAEENHGAVRGAQVGLEGGEEEGRISQGLLRRQKRARVGGGVSSIRAAEGHRLAVVTVLQEKRNHSL